MDYNALPEKKKRGRKSKKELEMMKILELENHEQNNNQAKPGNSQAIIGGQDGEAKFSKTNTRTP